MKASRVAKKSSARTKHQIEMERRRAGHCVVCGGGMTPLNVGVAVIQQRDGQCGSCRFLGMGVSGGD